MKMYAAQKNTDHLDNFKTIIWDYYKTFGRFFPWRETTDPYHIVVSEIMLQQTQTDRVVKKFEPFIYEFRNFCALDQAPFRDVLALWQGLGYNRRAMALHKIAQIVEHDFGGQLPNDPEMLQTFPGLGHATASSICAFAFNAPTVFIETNIRTVFIHFFFRDKEKVNDKELTPLIEKTVDRNNPRQWYYALMDYGVMLKKKFPNPSRKSAHHTAQSRFQGSDRQIRGMILRALVDEPKIQEKILVAKIAKEPGRVQRILGQILDEGFACKKGQTIYLS